MAVTEPKWLTIARSYIGVKEVPGIETSPVIYKWLQKLKSAWTDDATPWCGTFVAHCMSEIGVPIPVHWYRARAWLDWGDPMDFATVGCVVVYERKGGGHVGFVAGKDAAGNLMTLGGNQADAVNIKPFPLSRVLGYRWPKDQVIIIRPLPLLDSDGKTSTNEQ